MENDVCVVGVSVDLPLRSTGRYRPRPSNTCTSLLVLTYFLHFPSPEYVNTCMVKRLRRKLLYMLKTVNGNLLMMST